MLKNSRRCRMDYSDFWRKKTIITGFAGRCYLCVVGGKAWSLVACFGRIWDSNVCVYAWQAPESRYKCSPRYRPHDGQVLKLSSIPHYLMLSSIRKLSSIPHYLMLFSIPELSSILEDLPCAKTACFLLFESESSFFGAGLLRSYPLFTVVCSSEWGSSPCN